MPQAVWTPLAALELEDILFYIRVVDGRPETSQRIGKELLAVVDQQLSDPSRGQKHSAAPPDWYYVRYKRWLIFYQLHANGIEVMRVVDAVRDLPTLLGN